MSGISGKLRKAECTGMSTFHDRQVGVVLAAHGERAGDYSNSVLLRHADAIRDRNNFACVAAGVLNGTPAIADALECTQLSGAQRIFVYPFFMSDGYFVGKVLPERITEAGTGGITSILPPLGADPNLPSLMLQRALQTAATSRFDPRASRLLVVGHGSKGARASKQATLAIADKLREDRSFAEVDIALLEEPPLLDDALCDTTRPTVVAGFFAAPGLHAAVDVPQAIARTSADAVFTGAIGANAGIADLIERAVADGIAKAVAS